MKIGVFGRTKASDKKVMRKAKEIGKIIALNGHTLITGGTEGYSG